MSRTIRIGGFSAFWGDSPLAAAQLIKQGGQLDYLIGDYLSEVTLAILARVKAQMAQASRTSSGGAGEGGYVNEFVTTVWKPLMTEIMKRKIKIITNAGGMNPLALKKAIEAVAEKAGVAKPVVAAVIGDDVTKEASNSNATNRGMFVPFSVNKEDEDMWPAKERVMSSNVYFGAQPIAAALAAGAQIVVTGRCVDSALVLGPLIHEFGWKPHQLDLLSAGSLAGHLIECGCQCTGGNFTDWRDSYFGSGAKKDGPRTWSNVGYPIAECTADGSFIITKPENTGGIVSAGSVAEQMVYEILDPSAYILPDVVCDWTQVRVVELPMSDEQRRAGLQRSDRVSVTGAKGRPRTAYLKVGTTTMFGFSASAELLISGFDAAAKAEAVAQSILSRVRSVYKLRKMPDFLDTNVELIGSESTYGPLSKARNTREIMLRITVRHVDKNALDIFGTEVAPTATGMAPGITGGGSGRPKPTPVVKYYSCLVLRNAVTPQIVVGEGEASAVPDAGPSEASEKEPQTLASTEKQETASTVPVSASPSSARIVPLIALAYGRSGDKGDTCNIGVIARRPEYVAVINSALTATAVKTYLAHLIKGPVIRYSLPGIGGFNFVCKQALGGGGTNSLLIDRQGKSYAQKLLGIPIQVPDGLDVPWDGQRAKL